MIMISIIHIIIIIINIIIIIVIIHSAIVSAASPLSLGPGSWTASKSRSTGESRDAVARLLIAYNPKLVDV